MIPRNFLASVAIAFATITPANSQSSSTAAGPPLTQEDLIRRLDKLGTGDPAKQQPASVDDFPKPLREPKPIKKDKGPTEITASEATFDQKTHQATFAVKVVVKDPEFNVTCDRLTALLKSDKPKVATSGAKPATPVATPVPAAGNSKTPPVKGGGLERALAEGNVTIIQEKVEADGTMSRNIGKSQRADYDAVTGDILLTGWPQVQQGFNTCVAQEEGTVMTLNREGRMKVNGLHKTVIKESTTPDKP